MAALTLREQLLARAAALKAERDNQAKAEHDRLLAEQKAARADLEPTALAAAIGRTLCGVDLNDKQMEAAAYAKKQEAFCLIGAAGTGKTTSIKEVILQLRAQFDEKQQANIQDYVACVSFTNRAVKNISRNISPLFPQARHCCRTIHRLLAFKPVDVQIYDSFSQDYKDSRLFLPTFTADNPLVNMRIVIVEESSMVDVALFKQLYDACPNATFIFLGDLNQLKPVFGDAILGFKLNELPVVELTQVYRQAMESPIVGFQHTYTLKNKMPGDSELEKITASSNGQLTFHPLKQHVTVDEVMCSAMAKFFERKFHEGKYQPEEDIILIPYNKGFGSILLNLHIADFLAKQRNADVYEVTAGGDKHYLAVGDFVIHDRNEYLITGIVKNQKYKGKAPKPHSMDMDRWGNYKKGAAEIAMTAAIGEEVDDFTNLLNSISLDEVGDVENQASHIIELAPCDSESHVQGVTLNTRGQLNALAFGYCITIHKSQGSEWRRVYVIMTRHHAPMLCKELLYTAMTRAKEECYFIYSPQTAPGRKDSSISKAIGNQSIPGMTWREKAKHFRGKEVNYEAIMSGEKALKFIERIKSPRQSMAEDDFVVAGTGGYESENA